MFFVREYHSRIRTQILRKLNRASRSNTGTAERKSDEMEHEFLHLEEEEKEEEEKEDTKIRRDTKEDEVSSPSDNVEDEDERRKKNREHLSREMVVELQELRDLNVQSGTGVCCAVLASKRKEFEQKEEQEKEVFENVSYSDVMFTQASTSETTHIRVETGSTGHESR